MAKLAATRLASLKEPGRYSDGNNLYLQIAKTGGKYWAFIYRWQGRQKEMGLGPYPALGLADAREAALSALKLLKDRTNPRDPLAEREARRLAQKPKPLFGAFTETVLADIEHEWRNGKHRAQWRYTLSHYGKGIWHTPVDQIETDDVLRVLRPIWHSVPETASRVRGRIERILDAAKARGLRSEVNPARWKGHLDHLLPKRQKLKRGHHAAMPYRDLPAFMAKLRSGSSVSARALEFLILCASRSGEVRGMLWDEVDLDGGVWTIPADRMKAGRPHRVPLAGRALEILNELRPLALVQFEKACPPRPQGHIFRGPRGGGLSVMAFTMHMRLLGEGQYTVHGFRSAFRDWCGEETDFARETAEAALAHVIGDATERAYRRGDALEKRRTLMEAWGEFVI